MGDLDILDPPKIKAKFGGRDIEIKPLTMSQLPAFARALKPLMGQVENLQSVSPAEILDMLAEHGDKVTEAVSIATGIDIKEVGEASPIDVVALFSPIIKANADFFRLRLTLTELLSKQQAK